MADQDATEPTGPEVADPEASPVEPEAGTSGVTVDEAVTPGGDLTDVGVSSAPPEDGVAQTPEAVAAQRDEYFDALRRTQADFENFRKRSLKQQGDAIDRATARLAEDLLPVLDACDAAVLHGVEEIDAVVSALVGVLERSGLTRIEPSGEPFDPNAHDAVLHEAADDPDAAPTVVEVLRPGYAWKGRVIRPAMVKVKG